MGEGTFGVTNILPLMGNFDVFSYLFAISGRINFTELGIPWEISEK